MGAFYDWRRSGPPQLAKSGFKLRASNAEVNLSVVAWTEASHIVDGVFPAVSQHMDVMNLDVGFAVWLEEQWYRAARNLTSKTGTPFRISDDVRIPIEDGRGRRSRLRITRTPAGPDARLKYFKACLCFLYRLLETFLLELEGRFKPILRPQTLELIANSVLVR